MMSRLFYMAIFLLFASSDVDSAFADTAADIDFVQAKLPTVVRAQYMAHDCQPTTVEQWQGFPTLKCRYDSGLGNVPVILLDPDNAKLARWLVTACNDAGVSQARECAERIAAQIQCQSGAQFPVAGFVDEGPLYLFRDGITVSVREFNLHACAGLKRKPTAEEENLALQDGVVQTVCQYARITGTTRSEFAAFAKVPVPSLAGIAWQTQIREEYQAAWSSPRNRLISAWALGNAASLGSAISFAQFFQSACPKGTHWNLWF